MVFFHLTLGDIIVAIIIVLIILLWCAASVQDWFRKWQRGRRR